MPRVQAGEVQLGWREWGEGDITVVFLHGNLASKDWIELAAPLFPSGLRVIGIDWRGCGESDRPKSAADYSNYSMQQHALDMLAALDTLDVKYCHVATHSTGGIIAARMMLMQPERFGRVLALDPVTPLGLLFNAEQMGLFRAMMRSKELTRSMMATAAPSLFVPEISRRTWFPGSAKGLEKSRRCLSGLWNRRLASRKEFGSERLSTSRANGKAESSSCGWRSSTIRIWCFGVRWTAGLRRPISGAWRRRCRTAAF